MLRRRLLIQSGGYEFVDLGLPSGKLWATCNVGATKETEYGDYYMYGKGSRKYNSSDSYYHGNALSPSLDTVTQVMGSEWRTPTRGEFQELINETNYEWVTDFNGSGINGGKFTSKTNPNAYIFFPAAGYYMDGSLKSEGSEGYVLSSTSVDDDNIFTFYFGNRYYGVGYAKRKIGNSVRGVTSVGGGVN